MKNIKKLSVILLMAIGTLVYGQGYDAQRMQRDIEIAENILGTLANQDSDVRFWGNSIEGSYIEGYGVIFQLPRNYLTVGSRGVGAVVWSQGDVVEVPSGRGRVALDQAKADSIQESRKVRITEVMKTFLVDYADLINQLKASDKIMVIQKKSNFNYSVLTSGDGIYSIDDAKRESGISAEVKKSDLNDLKQGKITREQALSRVVMNYDLETNAKKEPDLELFSSILGRAFRQDLTDTYWTSSSPSYERLKGFGVIYSMRVYSRNSSGDYFIMPTLAGTEERVSREEGLKKVEEAYPKFESEIIKAMVEYGRTIRSLDDDENLMIKVKLTECRGCKMPESIDLSVKKSVLNQFDKGEMNLDAAIKQVKITKYPYK